MNNDQNKKIYRIDLGRVFHHLWRKKVIIIFLTLIFGATGYLFSSFMIKPKYEAFSDLIVYNTKTSSQIGQEGVTVADIQASSALIETYSVILKSHKVLEKVISDCNLSYSYNTLNNMISISSVGNTQVMRITVTDNDPDEALLIAGDIVKLAPDEITDSIDAGSVSTMDQPWTTREPVSPDIKKDTIYFALFGFLFGCSVIVIGYLYRDMRRTLDRLKDDSEISENEE